MLDLFLTLLVFVVGYVASIYSWPWVRTTMIGEWAEVNALRAKAAALESKMRVL